MTADMPPRQDSIQSTMTAVRDEEQVDGGVVDEQQEQALQPEEQPMPDHEQTPIRTNSQIDVAAANTAAAVEASLQQPVLSETDVETEAVDIADVTAVDTENADATPPPPPPKPLETRDASSSHNSREGLRLEVSRRRNTLTDSELLFLQNLTITGSDVEIELAMQTLADDNLFFEYAATPRHLKSGFSAFADDSTAGDLNTDYDGIAATDDPSITERSESLSNFDNIVVETRGSMGAQLHASSVDPDGDDDTRDGVASTGAGISASLKSSASSAKAVAAGNTNGNASENPPVPASIPVMIGSKKRMEVLERRRSDAGITLGKIWKAHETGLAVTAAASIKSLVRRQSIDSAVSALSATSGFSRQATQLDIFRRTAEAGVFRSNKVPAAIAATKRLSPKPTSKHLSSKQTPPRPSRRMPYHRSNSVTFGMIRSPVGKLLGSRPKIPPPMGLYNRRSSTGSRKSVTFHHINEEFEFDDSHHYENDAASDDTNEEKKMSAGDTPKRSKVLRRTVSDSIQYVSPSQKLRKEESIDEEGKQVQTPRESQVSSTSTLTNSSTLERQDSAPSIHHAHPIRQDSVTSFPSLHHGHPIRQDSMSSNVHPIRSDSVHSIPSLHHGHPLRDSTSVASIPSLHHGVPLRDNSLTSIPSLHHGQPIRSNSVHSIPSLHHGHPLQSPDDLSEDLRRSMTREQILQHFSASEDIASAWLQQASLRANDRNPSATSLGSLPHNVTVPLTDTDTSARNTSLDDLSVLSPSGADENDEPPVPKPTGSPKKPILLRLASKNVYEGEGIEVTQLEDDPLDAPRNISIFSMDASIRTVNSYDDMSMYSTNQLRTSDIFRTIRRSYSDESMSGMYLGSGRDLLMKLPDFNGNDTVGTIYGDDYSEASWDVGSEYSGRFDAWNVLQDDYVNGYGGGGTLGFSILGTSASDESAQPHVLSPPLMESLQAFMPYSKMGQNFFLKYSMVRDGAFLPALLRRARGLQYTVLAVETIDGEVFGSFTSQPWRKNWNYFGTGESFLWKMRRSRLEKTHGILEQAQKESEIEVYPYTGENRFIQLCTHDRLAVGGGLPNSPGEKKTSEDVKDHDFGFGLAIQSDMLQGSSSPCLTFGSPSLSNEHSDGSLFEVINIELWTLTPCATVEEAEKLELGKLFLQKEADDDMQYAY